MHANFGDSLFFDHLRHRSIIVDVNIIMSTIAIIITNTLMQSHALLFLQHNNCRSWTSFMQLIRGWP